MSDVHPTAARGFGATGDLYERARPGYPAGAVDYLVDALGLGPGSSVIDLGAGTGKFTRELVARGIPCVAVEPVEGMRETFRKALPDVRMMEGSGESIPVADASADAVTIAQAFHWFATEAAVSEIARVLRPGGSLGLIWNVRDETVEWVARVTDIFARYEGSDGIWVPRYREQRWRAPLEATDAFEPLAEREFRYSQTLSQEGLVERLASVSFIAVLPEDEKARAIGELRALMASHPDLTGRGEIVHPYVTEVYLFRRV